MIAVKPHLIRLQTALVLFSTTGLNPNVGKIIAAHGGGSDGTKPLPSTLPEMLQLVRAPPASHPHLPQEAGLMPMRVRPITSHASMPSQRMRAPAPGAALPTRIRALS